MLLYNVVYAKKPTLMGGKSCITWLLIEDLSTSTIPPTALNHTSVTTRLLVLCPNDVIKGFRLETGIREGHLPHNLHKSEAQNHNAASIPNQKKFGSVFQPNRVGFNHSNQSPNAHSHLPQALVFTSNSSFLSFF